ncbi:hypothetical protein COLO4_15670 [Corchorus olitorius]|uniref:Uncharacterized protein n=1 Tax=Corchorus olitorius TaxID=93759 RepID=A0A1R3JLS7_9ROSI|nr:hypothetical protein COLO4_15670 [Corchorus olitorius]
MSREREGESVFNFSYYCVWEVFGYQRAMEKMSVLRCVCVDREERGVEVSGQEHPRKWERGFERWFRRRESDVASK